MSTTQPPMGQQFSNSGQRYPHYWKVRLGISFVMLALAFVSLLIFSIHKTAYWVFNCLMAAIDAILCMAWVGYIKYQKEDFFLANLWHMILHWLGLMVVLYILSILVHQQVVSKELGGLFVLLSLGLTLYLAGIYADLIFIPVGFVLALLAFSTLFRTFYLWLTVLLAIAIIAIIIFAIVFREKNKI